MLGQGHKSEVDTTPGFRTDLQGLRAVAVLLVVLNHAGVPWLSGGFVGVDVFLVLSGYLITGGMKREIDTKGRLSIRNFYRRRIRRILPASSVVLVFVTAFTLLVLPETRWLSIAAQLTGSALFVENWILAISSTDYFASANAHSPLQHYWSLGVEEQFYLVWPLLIAAAAWFSRSRGPIGQRRRNVYLISICLLVFALSFAWSISYTSSEPEVAYFATTTRVWEFALGGSLVFLQRGAQKYARIIFFIGGWLGATALAFAALAFDQNTPYPGVSALIPTAGTAAIILSGSTTISTSLKRLLSHAVLVKLGRISFSFYLWHWPLLVFGAYLLGEFTVMQALLIVGFAVLPSWLSQRFLEQPFLRAVRADRPLRGTIRVAIVVTALTAGSGLVVLQAYQGSTAVMNAQPGMADFNSSDGEGLYGAMVLDENPRDDPSGSPVSQVPMITPDPLLASIDWNTSCPVSSVEENTVRECTFGDDQPGSRRILLVGDSHLEQWLPPLRAIAAERGWQVVTYLKRGCPFTDPTVAEGLVVDESCAAWNMSVQNLVKSSLPFEITITSNATYETIGAGRGTLSSSDSASVAADGLRAVWRMLTSEGSQVIVIRDTPQPGFDVADCVAAHRNSLDECSSPRAPTGRVRGLDQIQAAQENEDVRLIDLSDAICPTEECAPVIGGVLVYRDSNHLTATYARSLTPRLEALLEPVDSP